MTAERLQTIRNLIGYVPTVFAAGGLRSNPSDNSDGSTSINWASGIPPSYAEMEQDGGKRALLADINCIGSLATRELYLLQHGGYHTYDSRVADIIGGYGVGAILDWMQPSTGLLRKVRCVKEGGNCYTPIDDPDHGVESPEPHWQIVDIGGEGSFSMSDLVAIEILDPEYDSIYAGTNALYMQRSSFSPGSTYYTNTWTSPADVKVVAPAVFTDRYGYFKNAYPWNNGITSVWDIPNPCCAADGMYTSVIASTGSGSFQLNGNRFYSNSVTLVISAPDGSASMRIPMVAMSPWGKFSASGDGFGPVFLQKGTTMRFEVPTQPEWGGGLLNFNFKFKVYKV